MELTLFEMPTQHKNKSATQIELHDPNGTVLAVAVSTDVDGEFRVLEQLTKEPRYANMLINSLLNKGKSIKYND